MNGHSTKSKINGIQISRAGTAKEIDHRTARLVYAVAVEAKHMPNIDIASPDIKNNCRILQRLSAGPKTREISTSKTSANGI
jgi:hypothetical protein